MCFGTFRPRADGKSLWKRSSSDYECMVYHDTGEMMESKHRIQQSTAEPWKEYPQQRQPWHRRHVLVFAYFAAFSYSLVINRSRLQAQSSGGLSVFGPRKGVVQRPDICDALVQQSPFQQWIAQLERIRMASRLSLDHDYVLENVTNTVLLQVTEFLPHALKTIPTEDLSALVQKVERRYQYLQHPYLYSSEPPPMTITVLGGSVTAGVQCSA